MEFSITRPSDFHVHFRDDHRLPLAVKHTSRQMHYAVVMPNLVPPITQVEHSHKYHEQIKPYIQNQNFTPLYTLYLTDNTTEETIKQAAENPNIIGFKLYPAGATTNSDQGVTNIKQAAQLFEFMQKHGANLLIHGEVTRPEIDIFDREAYFFDEITQWLLNEFPKLRITHEHITTKQAAQFVTENNLGATITPQHLLYNRNALFEGNKIRPHNFCLPILKAEEHRKALLKAATSGSAKIFAGTDSAPHLINDKECCCGCAGCYSAGQTVELYAEIFDKTIGLTNKEGQKAFEQFISLNGCKHYNLKVPTDTMTLKKETQTIPAVYQTESLDLIPFMAKKELSWSII